MGKPVLGRAFFAGVLEIVFVFVFFFFCTVLAIAAGLVWSCLQIGLMSLQGRGAPSLASAYHKPMDIPVRRNFFDALPSDLVVSVLSFLSVRDVSRSACCDRRICYLVYKLQQARPELVVSVLEDTDSPKSSSSGSTAVDVGAVFRRGLSQLSGRPNVAFAFFPGDGPVDRQHWLRAAQRHLPNDTSLLVASSHATHASAGKLSDETNPNFSLMLGAFPEANVCPFSTNTPPAADDSIQEALRKATPLGEDMAAFWKVRVVAISLFGDHNLIFVQFLCFGSRLRQHTLHKHC